MIFNLSRLIALMFIFIILISILDLALGSELSWDSVYGGAHGNVFGTSLDVSENKVVLSFDSRTCEWDNPLIPDSPDYYKTYYIDLLELDDYSLYWIPSEQGASLKVVPSVDWLHGTNKWLKCSSGVEYWSSTWPAYFSIDNPLMSGEATVIYFLSNYIRADNYYSDAWHIDYTLWDNPTIDYCNMFFRVVHDSENHYMALNSDPTTDNLHIFKSNNNCTPSCFIDIGELSDYYATCRYDSYGSHDNRFSNRGTIAANPGGGIGFVFGDGEWNSFNMKYGLYNGSGWIEENLPNPVDQHANVFTAALAYGPDGNPVIVSLFINAIWQAVYQYWLVIHQKHIDGSWEATVIQPDSNFVPQIAIVGNGAIAAIGYHMTSKQAVFMRYDYSNVYLEPLTEEAAQGVDMVISSEKQLIVSFATPSNDQVWTKLLKFPLVECNDPAPMAGNSPLKVDFFAEQSNGLPPLEGFWDFDDGSVGEIGSLRESHTYINETAGSLIYHPTFETEDALGKTAACISTVTINAPLKVDSIANPYKGNAPLSVDFFANTYGGTGSKNYNWDFGDSSSPGTGQSVNHAYTTPGQYIATVTVTDESPQNNIATDTLQITVNAPLFGIMTSDLTEIIAPYAVEFDVTPQYGTLPYVKYVWDFGDGTTETTFHPTTTISHTYYNEGEYTPKVTIYDSSPQNNTYMATGQQVVVYPAMALNPVADPNIGDAPMTVDFTANFSGGDGAYTTISWDFGDGSDVVYEENPTHEFMDSGDYTVTVSVSDTIDGETYEASDTVAVHVNPTLEVSGEGSPTVGNAPLTVTFSGNVEGGTSPYSYLWDFGDSGGAETPDAAHVYQNEGTYHATLTVWDYVSAASVSDPIVITVNPDLLALASSDVTEGAAPLTVHFDGGQSGGTPPYAYLWDFGDTQTSTDEDPVHAFNDSGEYVVTFTVTDATTDFARKTIVITVTPESTDDDTVDDDTVDDDSSADDDIATDDDAADDDITDDDAAAGDDDSGGGGGGCGC